MSETLTVPDRIRKIVADHLGVQPGFEDSAVLTDDLGADSLDRIELAVAVEEEFNLSLEDEKVDGWFTVADIIRTVEGMR